MKTTKKIISMVMLSLAALLTLVTTVGAEAIGDTYTPIAGFGIGWMLIVAVIVIGVVAIAMQVTKKVIKPFIPILVIMFIVGLAIQYDIPEPAAEITETATWEVTAVSGSAGMTIDNDARTITKVIGAHPSLEVINQTGDVAWVAATDDSVINFTISPSLIVGISETTNQATTNCIVNNPDQSFTEDSTAYDLFEDASTGGDKNLAWTTDGTSGYESKLCTVTIGGSETAQLTIHLLDDGLSQREVGESHTFTISVGGITYTMTVMITETNDMDS